MYTLVEFIKDHPEARTPERKHPSDSGFDLYACEKTTLHPGEGPKLINVGIRIRLPVGMEAQIRPRSGLALRHGVTVLNSPGTIDQGYTGVVGVILINHGSMNHYINVGDRIAQLVLSPVVTQARFKKVEEFSDLKTDRGEGGYGSTGL